MASEQIKVSQQGWRVAVQRRIRVVAVGLGLATLAASLAGSWWLFELAVHWPLQLGLLGLAGGLVAAGLRAWGSSAALLTCACINLAVWGASGTHGVTPISGDVALSVMTFNVHSGNDQSRAFVDHVRQLEPDLILMLEVTPSWMSALSELHPQYQVVEAEARLDNFGIALLARHPAQSARLVRATPQGPNFVEARMAVAGRTWSILGIHPVPPISPSFARDRDRGLEYVASWAKQQSGLAVVLGDFNTTPYAPSFRRLLEDTELVHARRGSGYEATWPVAGWIPSLARIPIDHVLHSPDVTTVRLVSGPALGSDHLPITAWLGISE